MKPNIRNRIVCLALAFTAATPLWVLRAQRLTNRIDNGSKTILPGSRNPRVDTLVSVKLEDCRCRKFYKVIGAICDH